MAGMTVKKFLEAHKIEVVTKETVPPGTLSYGYLSRAEAGNCVLDAVQSGLFVFERGECAVWQSNRKPGRYYITLRKQALVAV
jgi:hypothetical protein